MGLVLNTGHESRGEKDRIEFYDSTGGEDAIVAATNFEQTTF